MPLLALFSEPHDANHLGNAAVLSTFRTEGAALVNHGLVADHQHRPRTLLLGCVKVSFALVATLSSGLGSTKSALAVKSRSNRFNAKLNLWLLTVVTLPLRFVG